MSKWKEPNVYYVETGNGRQLHINPSKVKNLEDSGSGLINSIVNYIELLEISVKELNIKGINLAISGLKAYNVGNVGEIGDFFWKTYSPVQWWNPFQNKYQ